MLVAQSMGGLIAPLLVDRLPVSRIVLVNAMIPAPGETGGDWWATTGQGEAQRAYDVAQGRTPGDSDPLVRFFHDVPEDITAYGMAHDPGQSGTPFGDPWPLTAWPDVPTRVISGRDDRLFPAVFQRRVAEQRLGITPEVLPGRHLIALSRPAELVASLLG